MRVKIGLHFKTGRRNGPGNEKSNNSWVALAEITLSLRKVSSPDRLLEYFLRRGKSAAGLGSRKQAASRCRDLYRWAEKNSGTPGHPLWSSCLSIPPNGPFEDPFEKWGSSYTCIAESFSFAKRWRELSPVFHMATSYGVIFTRKHALLSRSSSRRHWCWTGHRTLVDYSRWSDSWSTRFTVSIRIWVQPGFMQLLEGRSVARLIETESLRPFTIQAFWSRYNICFRRHHCLCCCLCRSFSCFCSPRSFESQRSFHNCFCFRRIPRCPWPRHQREICRRRHHH